MLKTPRDFNVYNHAVAFVSFILVVLHIVVLWVKVPYGLGGSIVSEEHNVSSFRVDFLTQRTTA